MACESNMLPTAHSGVCIHCYDASESDFDAWLSAHPSMPLPVCIQPASHSTALPIAIHTINSVCLILTCAIAAALIYHRKHKSVRAASLTFCLLTLFAAMLTHVCVYVLASTSTSLTTSSCLSLVWLGHTAFTLAFSALFAKIHRIWRIFSTTVLRVTIIRDAELMRVVAAIVGIMQLYLLCWFIIDPLRPTMVVHMNESFTVCSSSSAWVSVSPIFYEFALLLWGTLLCIRTRKAPDQFNEAPFIGVCVYNILIVGALVLPLYYFLLATPDSQLAVAGFALILVSAVAVSVLFLPKLHAIRVGAAKVRPLDTATRASTDETPKGTAPGAGKANGTGITGVLMGAGTGTATGVLRSIAQGAKYGSSPAEVHGESFAWEVENMNSAAVDHKDQS